MTGDRFAVAVFTLTPSASVFIVSSTVALMGHSLRFHLIAPIPDHGDAGAAAVRETSEDSRNPSSRRAVGRFTFPFPSFSTSPAFAVALTLG